MKKTALLLSLLFFTGRAVQAQNTFAQPGAEWHYSSLSSFGQDAIYFVLHAKVTGDTLIGGQSCRVVQQDGRRKNGDGRQGPVQWSPELPVALRSFYVYSNSDTTFIYNELFQKFTPLYIFNVTEGQTVCVPVIADITGTLGGWPISVPHPLTGDSSFCYVVDSIRMVTYDTSVLRTVYTHAVYDPADLSAFPDYPVQNWSHAGYAARGAYIEKIGGWRGGLLPKPLYFTGLFDGMENTQFLNMNCYSDNNTRIRLSASACDSLPPTTLSISDHPAFSGLVYPNPARDHIVIRGQKPFEKDMQLRLYDVSGRALKTTQLPFGAQQLVLPLSGIPAGFYFLSITSGTGVYYQKIVLQP